jgi:hypothetical protein
MQTSTPTPLSFAGVPAAPSSVETADTLLFRGGIFCGFELVRRRWKVYSFTLILWELRGPKRGGN